MHKYNRNYQVTIDLKGGGQVTLQRPFTIEFDIQRNTLSSANVGSFRIYNLTPDTRSRIRHDQYDWGDHRKITFHAGYDRNLAVAFTGYIRQAWSVREGNNFVTQIESFDGGLSFSTAQTALTLPKNTTMATVLTNIAKDLPGVELGAISSKFNDPIARGATYNGSTVEILNDLTGGSFFIDNGKVNFLLNNECINFGGKPIINAQSGLLGTPVRENTYINLKMLFEPTIQAGMIVNLQSLALDGGFNGDHKVVSIAHRGTISDAVCGDATTSLGLFPGNFNPVYQKAAPGV